MSSFLSRALRPFTSTTSVTDAVSGGSARTIPEGAERATLAAGCFWGVEHMYRKHFQNRGLLSARVGYIGGNTSSPSYRAVCSGATGHAEAVDLVYDPTKVSYGEIIKFFYRMHDPTTMNRQGPDAGTQYRSAIFTWDDEQEKIAKDLTERVGKEWWKNGVKTQVLPAGRWYDAEEYHQLYLDKNPGGYECPSHYLRTFPELSGGESSL